MAVLTGPGAESDGAGAMPLAPVPGVTAAVPGTVLLAGIVGSTAYGLAHAGSDVDRLGVFAVPTTALHGLRPPAESRVTTRPDVTFHEAAKWCRLALVGNPTASELVWLPDELYETRTPLGEELIAIRSAFLCRRAVRDAFLGYATQQFRKLRAHAAAGTAEPDARALKNARHLLRLLAQGEQLHATGTMTVRVADPDLLRERAAAVLADPEHAGALLDAAAERIEHARSPLPEHPDTATVEAWLRRVRAHFYDPSGP